MTAIQTIEIEIKKIQYAMAQCVNEYGYVNNHCKYRYKMLVEKLREFKESKTWLEEQNIGVNVG